MKKIIIYSILLCCSSVFSQEKVNKATYTFSMLIDNISEKKQEYADEINDFAELTDLIVLFNSKYSYYGLESKSEFDPSLDERFLYTPNSLDAYYPKLYVKDKNYFLNPEALVDNEVVLDDNVCVWELLDESKIINGYTCFKAIGKLKWIDKKKPNIFSIIEAWYCPELPYNYGPAKYNNLPGLVVLAIKNNEILFQLTKLEFDVNYEIPLEYLKKKSITVYEYDEIHYELFDD